MNDNHASTELEQIVQRMISAGEPEANIAAAIKQYNINKPPTAPSHEERFNKEQDEAAAKDAKKFANQGHITAEQISEANTGGTFGFNLGDASIIPALQDVYGDDFEITNPSSWSESIQFQNKRTGEENVFSLRDIGGAEGLQSSVANWVDTSTQPNEEAEAKWAEKKAVANRMHGDKEGGWNPGDEISLDVSGTGGMNVAGIYMPADQLTADDEQLDIVTNTLKEATSNEIRSYFDKQLGTSLTVSQRDKEAMYESIHHRVNKQMEEEYGFTIPENSYKTIMGGSGRAFLEYEIDAMKNVFEDERGAAARDNTVVSQEFFDKRTQEDIVDTWTEGEKKKAEIIARGVDSENRRRDIRYMLENGVSLDGKELSDEAKKDLNTELTSVEANLTKIDEDIKANAEEHGSWFGVSEEELASRFMSKGDTEETGYAAYRAQRMAEGFTEASDSADSEVASYKQSNPGITDREALKNWYDDLMIERQVLDTNGLGEVVEVDLNKVEPVMRTVAQRYLNSRPGGYDGNPKVSIPVGVFVKPQNQGGLDMSTRDFEGWFDKSRRFVDNQDWGLSEEDLNKIDRHEYALDKNLGHRRAAYELAYLDFNPESVDAKVRDIGSGGAVDFVGKLLTSSVKAIGTQVLDASEAEAEGVFNLERDRLNALNEASMEFNSEYADEIADGELQALSWTPEQAEAFESNMSENVANGVGEFVPTLVELAALTVATEGAMTSLGVTKALTKLKQAGGAYNKFKYHMAHMAIEEAKMQTAGFKPGSGAAFYAGGALTPWFRPGALSPRMKGFDPLFQKTIKAGVVGSASGELAAVTELGWESIKGESDFGVGMRELFSDFDEVEERMITNAFVFGIAGNMGKGRIKSQDFYVTPSAKLKLRNKLIKKANDILVNPETKQYIEDRDKLEKDYSEGKIEKDIYEGEKSMLDFLISEGKPRTIEELSEKEANDYESYVSTLTDVNNLFAAQTRDAKLDPKSKDFESNYQKIIIDPVNTLLKKANPSHTDVKVRFLSEGEAKNLLGEGNVAEYDPKSNEILFNKAKYHTGISNHELVHMALRQVFNKNGKRMEINFMNRLDKVFKDAYGSKLEDLLPVEEVREAYKEKSESEKSEEFLANLAEFMTNPEIYYTHVNNSFLKNAKAEIKSFLEESVPGMGSMFKPKTAHQFIDMLGRMGADASRGLNIGHKVKNLSNLKDVSFLGIEYVEATNPRRMASRDLAAEREVLKQENLELAKTKPDGWVDIAKTNTAKIQDLTKNIEAAQKNFDLIKEYEALKPEAEKEGASEIDRLRASRKFEQLRDNNSGILENYINKTYKNVEGSNLTREQFSDYVYNTEFNKLVNSYLKRGEKNKDVQFGAYLQLPNTLALRTGNILKGLGVDLQASMSTKSIETMMETGQDIVAPEPTATEAPATKGIDLAFKLPVEQATIDAISQKAEGLSLENLNYKTLVDQAPAATKAMFGKSTQAKANFIANNWKTLYDALPKNLTETTGTATGVENSLMTRKKVGSKTAEPVFYEGTGQRVKFTKTGSAVGSEIKAKRKLSKSEFLAELGIKDNRVSEDLTSGEGNVDISSIKADRNIGTSVIPSLINQTGKAISNQIVRSKLKELAKTNPEKFEVFEKFNIDTFLNEVASGKSDKLAAKDLSGELAKKILERGEKDPNIRSINGIIAAMGSPAFRDFTKKERTLVKQALAKLQRDLTKELFGIEESLGKQVELSVDTKSSELEALEAKNYADLTSQLMKRHPEFKDMFNLKEGLETWSEDITALANQNKFDLKLLNKYPTALLNVLRTPMSATFYQGKMKRVVNGELTRMNLPKGGDFMSYANRWFKGEFKGSGKTLDSKEWKWVSDVNIIDTGTAKTRWANFIAANKSKSNFRELATQEAWNMVTGKKNATHADFMRTVEANQKLRQFHLESMADIVNNWEKGGFSSKADAVNAAMRHLRFQTNIGNGFMKGTATVTSMSFVEGQPVGKDLSAKNYLGTMFHAEHQLQLLNHSFSAMDIILRGEPKFNRKSKRYETSKQTKSELELLTKEFEQSFTIKQDQLIYDSPTYGGRTTFLKAFKNHKIGDVSSILNVMYRPGVAFELLDLKNPKLGSTIGESIIQKYSQKQVDLLLKEAAKNGPPNQLSIELGIRNKNRRLDIEHDAILENTKLNSKDLSRSEKLDLMKDIQAATANGRKRNPKRKGMSTWDFDDTLAKTKSDVLFTAPDGTKGKLNATEFAKQGSELLEQGYKFDFSEFNKVTQGEPGPFLEKALERAKKFGTKDQFILTARAQEAAPAIYEFLKSQGLEIPMENIVGLGNSTGAAKARWMLKKFAEGYNDMYFADDAIQNVDAVKYVMDRLDIKSDVQQARSLASRDLSSSLNEMIERRSGIGAVKEFSAAKARMLGKKRFSKSLVVPGAQDFMGLMQNFMGKGKQGNADRAFFEKNLVDPFARATKEMNEARQKSSEDMKRLYKDIPSVKRKINKTLESSAFTYDQAIRNYLWTKAGLEVPGLSAKDSKLMNDVVSKDAELLAFADGLQAIAKGEYVAPSQNWIAETIVSDLFNLNNKANRSKYLAEWIENKDIIFSEANMNKIEATQGTKFREALEDVLYRIETGSNRPTGSNRLANAHMNFINGSVGATMFLNMRSAMLQTISATNYINWAENNPLKAAQAFGNQKQYWKDFSMIWNSPMLKQRRAGLEYNVQEAELAAAVAGQKNKAKAALAWLIKKGFTPTQAADSFAIAAGGSTYYRNRVKMYEKQGLSKAEAKDKAFLDFQEITETSQQSSRADLISQQQASSLGRTVLAWANTPMQYMRIQEKAARDIANGRGDFKSNVSKIAYYGAIQSIIFASLQNALFSFGLDEEENLDDADFAKRTDRIIQTVIDGQLRGMGVGGAAMSAIKNTILEFQKQELKAEDDSWFSKPDHTKTILQLTSYSPVIGSKLRKLYSASQTWNYNRDAVQEMGLDISNPALEASANVIEATTNVPIARIVRKINNLKEVADSENQNWQRVASLMGYSAWDLGIENTEVKDAKDRGRQKKKDAEGKALEDQFKKDQRKERDQGKETTCAGATRSGGRCSNKPIGNTAYCTVHQKVDKRADGKKTQCTHVKKDGKRCKMKTTNKSGKCYYHD